MKVDQLQQLEPKQAELVVLTQVRKHMGDTSAMQKLNFDVNVSVCRLPDPVGRILYKAKDKMTHAELKAKTENSARPAYQLRAEHELNVQNQISVNGQPPLNNAADTREQLMRENYIYPNGGITTVEFTHPLTGKKYVGESRCHISDQFVRERSRFRAWGRVYRQLLQDSRFGVKRGKQLVNELVSE
jgi:hypothetical protein